MTATSSSSTGATDRFLRLIRRSVEVTIVTLFTVLTIAVFVQVVARYVFNQPPTWTDDTNRRGQARSPGEEQHRSDVCHMVRVVVGHGDDAEAIDVQAGTYQLAAHSVPRIDEVDVIVHHDGVRRRRPLDLGRRTPGRSE